MFIGEGDSWNSPSRTPAPVSSLQGAGVACAPRSRVMASWTSYISPFPNGFGCRMRHPWASQFIGSKPINQILVYLYCDHGSSCKGNKNAFSPHHKPLISKESFLWELNCSVIELNWATVTWSASFTMRKMREKRVCWRHTLSYWVVNTNVMLSSIWLL